MPFNPVFSRLKPYLQEVRYVVRPTQLLLPSAARSTFSFRMAYLLSACSDASCYPRFQIYNMAETAILAEIKAGNFIEVKFGQTEIDPGKRTNKQLRIQRSS